MSVALDTGSSAIRSLRRVDDRLHSRSARCVYAVLPDSPAHRRLLDQAGLSITTCDDGILLLGDAAYESSDLFRTPSRLLLTDGRLPQHDPLRRQLIGTLFEAVLPVALDRGETCCMTLPGGADVDGADSRGDLEFFIRLVRLQGYEPQIIPSSQALILGELVRSSFTGIGIVFGASGCEAMLAHRGVPVCHARSMIGGHWIDRQLLQNGHLPASGTFEDKETERAAIEQARENLTEPPLPAVGQFAQAASQFTKQVIERCIVEFASTLNRTPRFNEVPQPIPVICSGGLTAAPGFEVLLNEVLQTTPLPLELQQPQFSKASARAVTRGLLISAELESDSGSNQAAA